MCPHEFCLSTVKVASLDIKCIQEKNILKSLHSTPHIYINDGSGSLAYQGLSRIIIFIYIYIYKIFYIYGF